MREDYQNGLADFINPYSRIREPLFITPNKNSGYVEPPNVQRNDFSWKGDFYRISFRVKKATHGLVFDCPYDVFLVFRSFEEAKLFSINYMVVASNLPQPVNEVLNMVIKGN